VRTATGSGEGCKERELGRSSAFMNAAALFRSFALLHHCSADSVRLIPLAVA